jgi:hypothetical protein
MAFTAGSVELAKAQKLGNQLSHLFSSHGLTGAVGSTGARMLEKYAKKLGFGITGLTSGTAFPPFGTANSTLGLGIEAALQNPRGETMASGFSLGAFEGQTVGIYLKKFVNSGAGYKATLRTGVTLSVGATSGAGTTFVARGPVAVSTYDTLDFGDGVLYTVRGFTAAATGETAHIGVWNTITSTYATGSAFTVLANGITRGTSGVAGSTSESYTRGNLVNGGYTAAVFFGNPAGGSAYFAVS